MMSKNDMPKIIPLPMFPTDTHRHWELTEEWRYDRWDGIHVIIEKGFIFNGASIPKVFSNIFASTGILFLASLVHDHIYQYRYILVEHEIDGKVTRQKMYLNKDRADEIFKEIALISYPHNKKSIWLAKTALSIGGRFAWNDSRKKEKAIAEAEILAEYKKTTDQDGN